MSIEVTRDEVDKQQFDGSAVKNLDPNFHHRWARVDNQKDLEADRNLQQRMLDGYEIVTRTTEEHPLSDVTRIKQGLQLDNTIRWGDLILVRIPKEQFERRVARERARTARQTLGVTRAYRDAIRKITGEEHLAYEEHRDPKGIGGYSTSKTSAEGEEMTEAQMQKAMKLAGAVTEDP